MAGITLGSNLRAELGARAEAGARATAALMGEVAAQSAAEVWAITQALLDQGCLEPNPEPPSCTRCGLSLSPGGRCDHCGAEAGEQDPDETPDPDEEIDRSEEQSAGEDDWTGTTDAPAFQDLPERLRDRLLALGWERESAERDGLWLCALWEECSAARRKIAESEPANLETLAYWIREATGTPAESQESLARLQRLTEPEVMMGILMDCLACAGEIQPPRPPRLGLLIQIMKIDDEWQVSVIDPLDRYTPTRIAGSVLLANRTIPLALWLQLRAEHRKRLVDLGWILLDERQEFFEALERVAARRLLKTRPLEQQQAAKELLVNASTLSKWCKRESGIQVETPHGRFELRAFFREEKETQLLEQFVALLSRRRVCPHENVEATGKWLIETHQIELPPRTLSRRLKYIKIWEGYRGWAIQQDCRQITAASLEDYLTKEGIQFPAEDRSALLKLIDDLATLQDGEIWDV